jgi:hypothetical protein
MRIKVAGFKKRTIFSGWDVFRSQMPLQTIINPALVERYGKLFGDPGRKREELFRALGAHERLQRLHAG